MRKEFDTQLSKKVIWIAKLIVQISKSLIYNLHFTTF